MEAEQMADLFAAYYTSFEDFRKNMTWLIRTRLQMEWDEGRYDAANEMRLRRTLIKSLSTEDEIIQKMCVLCSVDDITKA